MVRHRWTVGKRRMIRVAVGVVLIAAFPLTGYAALSHTHAASHAGAGAVAAKAVAPSPTAAPVVSGAPKELQVLTSSSGSWSGTAPIALAYQWQRCAPVSRLTNGGFETDAAGWTGNNGAAISQSMTQAHSGTGSLKVVTVGGSSNGQGAVYRFAAGQIQAGHNYRFSVWVGTTGPATVATIIRFYDSAGAEVPDGGYPYITTLGWNLLGIRLTAPAGAVSGLVSVTVDKTATTFYVDDASFSDCSPITGATSASYTVQAADAGSALASVVTASNSVGSSNAMSNMTSLALDKFDTAPAYTGPVYSDNTSAAAGDPPAPPPITTTLPTWRNLYDWPNGHGYAGWHYATSATDSRYGADTNHGGNYGLWLWPVGGQQYTPNYAEWTYTAPGTTRISTVNLTFAYRNKFLAHHCLEVGLRTLDGTIVSQNKWCKPALPPDSQRDVQVKLADPNNEPTAKVLFFRVEFPACPDPSSPSCSKYIPQLDPLTTGANARLKLADMIVVDDDNPLIQPTRPLWDIRDHFIDGTQTYAVTLGSAELGSGIVSSTFSHTSTYPPATESLGAQNAPCDAAHNTPPLDNRICPATFSWDTSVPTPPYPEGPNAFTETATDNAGNVGSQSWTIYIDRTTPDSVDASGDFFQRSYVSGSDTYPLTLAAHDPGVGEQRASGIARVWASLQGGGEVVSSNAPCSTFICPDSYSADVSIGTSGLPEGANTFTAHAVDLVRHATDGPSWTVLVDRTGPNAPSEFEIWSFDPVTQEAVIDWTQEATDPDLPTGEPGSGVARSEYRYRVNGGAWGEWTDPSTDEDAGSSAFTASNVTAGDVIDVEARETDSVGNVGQTGSASLTVPADAENVPDTTVEDPGAIDPLSAPIPIDPPDGSPVEPPILHEDDPEDSTVDPEIFHPLASFLGRASSAQATAQPSAAASLDVSSAFDASNPCGLGSQDSFVRGGTVSGTTLRWSEYTRCVVFFTGANDTPNWTIFTTCVQQPDTADGGAATRRRGVGPGYIAIVRDGRIPLLVNDLRWRTRAGGTAKQKRTDAAFWNIGNIGAMNGGLGTFEVQYARGVPGSAPAGTGEYLNYTLNHPAQARVNPITPGLTFPKYGDFISERYCSDEYVKGDPAHGVPANPAYGVYYISKHKPKIVNGTIRYQIEVWLKDPQSHSSGSPEGKALLAVQHYYRFTTTGVDAVQTVKVFPQGSSGTVPLVKEPKYGATVRAEGRFNRIRWYVQKGNTTSLIGAAALGQPEFGPWTDTLGIAHRGASLSTIQDGGSDRVKAEWAASSSCTSPCFDVVAKSMKALWMPATGPVGDPFTKARYPWTYQGTIYGLDGWAQRSASRDRAYPRDTNGGEVVTNCSADGAKRGTRADDPSSFPPNTNKVANWPGDINWLAFLTGLSTDARTNLSTVRRWELAGWKNGLDAKDSDDTVPYDGSAVMLHGWEGAAGPNDCEPLMVALGPQTEIYTNYLAYSFRSASG